MNIVIIEDELPAYKRLSKLLMDTDASIEILAHLDSVAAAETWFAENAAPDLVFMDIHLADGSGFDLLQAVDIPCPVIFVTAYDEYALEAFKVKSIDYIMKPVKQEDLEKALDQFSQYSELFKMGAKKTPAQKKYIAGDYKTRFVIRFGEHIKTLLVEDIAYCYSENKVTFAKTFDGRTFPMDYNLDHLDQMLNPDQFFRINRQYLINLKAIDEMKSYTKARVIVKLNPVVKEPPVVSSERASDFKLWLGGEIDS